MYTLENRFDKLVERFVQEFAKMKFYQELLDEPGPRRGYQILLQRCSDLQVLNELVSEHYIPATQHFINSVYYDIRHSKYRKHVQSIVFDVQDAEQDILRMGYVSLYHKWESFRQDLVTLPELMVPHVVSEISVANWVKSNYGFNFQNPNEFWISGKLSWIANCIKHYDGLPVKDPIHEDFVGADRSKKIFFLVE